LFGRALASSPLEVGIGLGIAVVGVIVGDVAGQVLIGLAGILISYSMTLKVAEERAQISQEEKSTNLREREISRLRGIYRQVYNTHIQILNATADPDDTQASFALITQSNRNLFFLLTEIEAIVGETDIRVASLANRLRSNIQEMDVLLETVPDSESVERLGQLETEQRDLKRQLASITAGAVGGSGTSAGDSYSSEFQLIEVTLSRIDLPEPGVEAWIEFLRRCVEGLAEVPEIRRRVVEQSLPLTAFGHALRRRIGHQLPSFPGYKGLSGLLDKAFDGTPYCVVMSSLSGNFRGIALRDHVPTHLGQLEFSGALEDQRAVPPPPPPGSTRDLMPQLVKLAQPSREWDLPEWAAYMREVVEIAMDAHREQSLQQVGNIFKTLSDIKPPATSGLVKLHAQLQLALTGSDLCVVRKEIPGEMAIVRRAYASSVGMALPDLVLVNRKPRVKDPTPESHSIENYRNILRNALPPLNLPQVALPIVLERLPGEQLGTATVDELCLRIGADLSEDLRTRVKPALGILLECGVIRTSTGGVVEPPGELNAEEVLEAIEGAAVREVSDWLGSAEEAIVRCLVRGEVQVNRPMSVSAPAAGFGTADL
jgi:hypothetical protein